MPELTESQKCNLVAQICKASEDQEHEEMKNLIDSFCQNVGNFHSIWNYIRDHVTVEYGEVFALDAYHKVLLYYIIRCEMAAKE